MIDWTILEVIAEGFVNFLIFPHFMLFRKKNIFQISIKYRKIKNLINPSAATSEIVQFIILLYEMKIKDF